MYNRADWTKAVNKLTRLTVEGELKWEIAEGFRPEGVDEVFRAYEVKYSGQGYRVYSGRKRAFDPEYEENYWENLLGFEVWRLEPVFGFSTRIAKSPRIPALASLYDAVEGRYALDQGALRGLLD